MSSYSYPRLFLFAAGMILSVSSFAQSVVRGKVTDDKNEPLTGSVVELRQSKDSSLAKVNITDAQGEYVFNNIKAGEYFLKFSLLGFTPFKGEPFTVDGVAGKTVPATKMSTTAVALKEATVTGIKPLVEVRADKTVFNVESSINAVGSTAYELLQKSPGVVVDNNDNILLKGRSGVLVQIDGRNTNLSQQELGDYLKSIQSTDVEAIELISNPSSKYDAEGTAGIINIKLKKNTNFGTNGNITLGYALGEYSKYNTGISLNNRSKKFSIYTNYSNNWGKRRNEFYLYREQNPYIFNSSSIFERWGLNHNYKAGVDYSANSKNTIGMVVTGNYNDINGTNNSQNDISSFSSDQVDSVLKSNQSIDGHASGINLNLNHHYTDTSGTDLATDFDIGYFDSNRDAYQPNIYMLPDGETILSEKYYRSVSPTTIHIYTLKTDYSRKFLGGKLGAGYKVSLVNTDNTYNFYNINGTMETIDSSRSNRFKYDENVYAFYLNYQHTYGKFDLQAGLRTETTGSEGDLVSAADTMENKNVKRNYTDFFPSGGITYNMNKDNSFGLIYSRRIDRPDYHDLNPFEMKLDELSYRKGNPFLDPQYSDKIELSHTWKYSTTTSVGYSHTHDFFAQITDTIPGGKSYITTQNLASEKIFSADLSSSLQPLKWYSLYLHLGYYIQAYKADFPNGKGIDESVGSFNLYAQNTIKLPFDLSFEISGWYNSSGIWGGSYVTDPQGSLDVGLQKKLLHDQATLKITCTDIFDTAPWNSYNVYGGIVIRVNGNWESQQFRASFNWRFGNKQMKNIRQHTTGNESEKNRIGGGDQ